MKKVLIDHLQVASNRQRREFEPDSIMELTESIMSKGLLHPIVVREGLDGQLILVAGERRIKALVNLWQLGGTLRCDGETFLEGELPYVTLGELDTITAKEAELEENVRRIDLTWQERAQARADLKELRTSQAIAAGKPIPTGTDLSLELFGEIHGNSQRRLYKELIVSQHLDNPDVATAKTVDEAVKILKRAETSKKNIELAERVGRTFTSAVHRIELGDSLNLMLGLPDESFDVILTDPPYGMGADEFGDSGGRTPGAHGYVDSYQNWLDLIPTLAAQAFRVAKPQAHIYIFCDIDRFPELKAFMQNIGWRVHRTPIIWHKPNGMRMPWPEHGPQRKYELILYAVKGNRMVTKIAPDVITISSDENLGHAAQKPVGLFSDLLRRSVIPGNTILDPFCGTGPIFPAAHELKCMATGFEGDSAYYGIAVKRVGDLK